MHIHRAEMVIEMVMIIPPWKEANMIVMKTTVGKKNFLKYRPHHLPSAHWDISNRLLPERATFREGREASKTNIKLTEEL